MVIVRPLFIGALFLLFIAGCIHKPDRYNVVEKKTQNVSLLSGQEIDLIKQQEAKLIDIPIPLNACPVPYYFADVSNRGQELSLAYESTMSSDDLVLFYTQEMERLGWKKAASIHTVETLLYFEKPDRFCVISLRPESEKTAEASILIIFFIGRK